MKNSYFKPKECKLSLSKWDIDLLLYAIDHCKIENDYKAEDFGGQDDLEAIFQLSNLEIRIKESIKKKE